MHPVEEYQNITYTVDGSEWVWFVTPTRRRWTLNNYITRCTGSSISLRQDAVEKASTQQSGPSGSRLSSWRSDKLEIRCCRENQNPERLAPRPLVEQPKRTGKKRYYGQKSAGQYVAVLFGLQLPLTHNPFSKVRGIFF